MTDWPVCPHGRFQQGHCFRCEFEPAPETGLLARLARWLDTHEWLERRVGLLVLLLAALWFGAHAAIAL